jgi:nucleoid-associated protein YgaU
VTKESKLALIIGFVLVLVVGVLVSDHFSKAQQMALDTGARDDESTRTPIAELGPRETQAIGNAFDRPIAQNNASAPDPIHQPVTIDNTNPRSILDDAIEYVENKAQNTILPKAADFTKKTPEKQPDPITMLPEPKRETYTVRAGDTLIGISRRYLGDGDRWKEIEALNADLLGPDSMLQVGMKLELPGDARILTLGSRDSGKSSGETGSRTYTVKTGDTLGEIAYKLLGTSKRADEIVKLNQLKSADTIYIGMTLKIPAK